MLGRTAACDAGNGTRTGAVDDGSPHATTNKPKVPVAASETRMRVENRRGMMASDEGMNVLAGREWSRQERDRMRPNHGVGRRVVQIELLAGPAIRAGTSRFLGCITRPPVRVRVSGGPALGRAGRRIRPIVCQI